MKKHIVSALALVVCAVSAVSSPLLKTSVQKIPFFERNKIEVVSVTPLAGMYEVIGMAKDANGNMSGQKFLLNAEKTAVVAGSGMVVIDAKTAMQVKAPVDISGIMKDEAMVIGHGTDEFVVFTDPECPYCQKLDTALKSMEDKVKIHVFFFPLSFHKNSNTMIDYVMSKPKNERFAALLETADPKFAASGYVNTHKNDSFIAKQLQHGSVLNVAGTPSVFKMDGTAYDMQMFMSKYTKPEVKTHVDINGLNFLKTQSSMLTINPDSNGSEIFVFSDTDCPFCQDALSKDSLSKLTQKYKVSVQLVPSQAHPDSFAEAVFVMSASTQAEKIKRFETMMADGKLSKDERDNLDALVKAKDKDLSEVVIKIGSMPQIMQQMGIEGTPTFVNADGKIVKITEL